MTASTRISTLLLAVLLATGGACAAEVDPAMPDYLRPLDAHATLETERGRDGRLTIGVRGERFDGRRLAASLVSEAWRGEAEGSADFDLHLQVAALAGFNDETLHDVDLALSRRGGRMSAFALTARSRGYAALRGQLRTRRGGQSILGLETDDAGALLRFADIFAHVSAGSGAIALDLAASADATREGMISLRDFNVARDRLAAQVRDTVLAPPLLPVMPQLEITGLHASFTLAPGKLTIANAMLRSPLLGATLEGFIPGDSLRLRGVLVPDVLKQMPEPACRDDGCVAGLPYTVQGTPQAPLIQIMTYVDISHRHLFDAP